MGHYYSEMYYDHRSEEQKKEDAKKALRLAQIEKNICKAFKIKKGELKLIAKILENAKYYAS